MQHYYATLAQARAEILANAETPGSTAAILESIWRVSARIDKIKDTTFEPVHETLYLDARGAGMSRDRRALLIGKPLLAVTSVTLTDGTVLPDSDYRLQPRDHTPYYEIRLTHSSGRTWRSSDRDWQGSIEVEAITGWHEHYSAAWVSGSTLTAVLNSTATSFVVASGAAFSPGQLLRINDEYLRLTDVSTNTLTVTRGVNGSVAASHDSADTVDYWIPDEVIAGAAIRWTGYLYKRRGNFEQAQFDQEGAVVRYPTDMPAEVANALSEVHNLAPWYAAG